MRQKKVFQITLAAFAIMLMILPFVVSINDLLTKGVEKLGWYVWIQRQVVPWEVRLVGAMIKPLHINFVAYPEGFVANGNYAKISWNCIGWQSLLLFLITIPIGFKGGEYTRWSKIEAFLIGILSIFLVNILRMAFTVVLLVVSKPLYARVYHDYLAAIMTVAFLIVYWWFCYSFVLEDKKLINADGKLIDADKDANKTDKRLILAEKRLVAIRQKLIRKSPSDRGKKVDDFLYENLTYQIRGAVFAVHNELGSGHKEKVYQEALAREFSERKIPFEKEKSLAVYYKNKKVGSYQPDFLVDGKVIIELKSIPFLSHTIEKQLLFYLKGTNYKLGLLVNFGTVKLDIRRMILTH